MSKLEKAVEDALSNLRLVYPNNPSIYELSVGDVTLKGVPEAKQALLRWREAYADKARIDYKDNLLRIMEEILPEHLLHELSFEANRISALRKVNKGEDNNSGKGRK